MLKITPPHFYGWPELDKACVTPATQHCFKKMVLPEAKPDKLVLQLEEP
jgi:hypothetical protein